MGRPEFLSFSLSLLINFFLPSLLSSCLPFSLSIDIFEGKHNSLKRIVSVTLFDCTYYTPTPLPPCTLTSFPFPLFTRMLMFECMREVCGAGDRCNNQRFQKKKYPNVCCFKTEDRAWGLKTLQDIKKGEHTHTHCFVIFNHLFSHSLSLCIYISINLVNVFVVIFCFVYLDVRERVS